MNQDWLSGANFERTHELLAAINTVSIHAKLRQAGVADPTPREAVDEARQLLDRFLERLQALISDAQTRQDRSIVGADPQLALLISSLVQPRQATAGGELSSETVSELRNDLWSDTEQDRSRLLPLLRSLRRLLEDQVRAMEPQ